MTTFLAVIAATQPPVPFENTGGGKSSGAGSLAFLVVIFMIVASIVLFWAMNRSLRRARRNLGGDQLPRRRGQRPRHVIPSRPDDSQEDNPEENPDLQGPAA